jgi:hypothetical protein
LEKEPIMNLNRRFVRASILCVLAGCSAATSGPEAAQPGTDTVAQASSALVSGNVSTTLHVKDATQCRPLEFPLTSFIADVFEPQALAEDDATAMSETECLHEQVIAAPAETWATLAYSVLCSGGNDTRRCGAVSARQCSVDRLMQWASQRSDAAFSRDGTFGFDYTLPPQHAAARTALYRRAKQEVQALLAETAQVMSEDAAGTRDCPSEHRAEIAAAFTHGQDMSRQLDDILSKTASK